MHHHDVAGADAELPEVRAQGGTRAKGAKRRGGHGRDIIGSPVLSQPTSLGREARHSAAATIELFRTVDTRSTVDVPAIVDSALGGAGW
jgi:hypothetical protein